MTSIPMGQALNTSYETNAIQIIDFSTTMGGISNFFIVRIH